MRFLRNKKLVLTFCLVLLVGFALPHFAHASIFTMGVSELFGSIMDVTTYALNYFNKIAFILAGSLVEFMLHLNLSVGDTGANPIVGVGWAIARDIANLGFVLAMIVIAFATIVGSESYGYKKLLPKLIAAALLVNFSLTIGGVFIDFSGVITNFFMNKITGRADIDPSAGVSEKLAGAFNIQRFLLPETNNPLPPNPAEETGLARYSAAYFAAMIEPWFVFIFTGFAAIILFLFAAMLMRRFVELSILLVFAPLTWLFWAIPGQSSLFSKWWSRFMNQVFFAPIMMFFVYLALGSAEALGNSYVPSKFFQMGAIQATMMTGVQATVLGSILVGGLIAAESMGIWGAKFGMSMMLGFGRAAKYMASNSVKGFGQKIAQSQTGQFIGRQALKFGPGMKKIGEYKPKNILGKAAMLAISPVRAPIQTAFSIAGRGLETMGGAPTKPDSLGSLAWAALTGGEKGVEAKISEAKKAKETTSLEEDEKSHEKKLKKLEELKKAGVDVRDIEKDIERLEGEMRKKTKLPETEDGLIKQAEEFELKREMLLSKGLKTSFFEAQRDATYKELSKMRKASAEMSPARTEWEKQIVAMTAKKDKDIETKTYIPAPGMKHDLDSKITAAKEQAAKWQRIEGQKPKTKAQWEGRAKDLEEASVVATNAKNDGYFSENSLEKITDLWNDAKKEIAEAEKKEQEKSRGNQKNTPREAPKEEKKSPIITEGFTENTPIANIRAEAATKAREEERARRAREEAERNAEGPKIIT